MSNIQECYRLLGQLEADQKTRERERQDHIRNQLCNVVFHNLDGWLERAGNIASLTTSLDYSVKNGDTLFAIANLWDERVKSADIYIAIDCREGLNKYWTLAFDLPE